MLMQSIRDATVLLIREIGPDKLTATGIAERAGVSVGSFYQYYPNTEAVLTDIYEHILDRLSGEIQNRVQTQQGGFNRSLEESIHDGVLLTLALHRELAAVAPSFYITFIKHFNITDARGPSSSQSWDEWSVGWLSKLLQLHSDELRHTDIQFVARFLTDMVSGGVHRIASERPEVLDDPKIAEHLSDLVLRYLGR